MKDQTTERWLDDWKLGRLEAEQPDSQKANWLIIQPSNLPESF